MIKLENDLSAELGYMHEERSSVEIPVKIYENENRVAIFWYDVKPDKKRIKLNLVSSANGTLNERDEDFYREAEIKAIEKMCGILENIHMYRIKHSWMIDNPHKRFLNENGFGRGYKPVERYYGTITQKNKLMSQQLQK